MGFGGQVSICGGDCCDGWRPYSLISHVSCMFHASGSGQIFITGLIRKENIDHLDKDVHIFAGHLKQVPSKRLYLLLKVDASSVPDQCAVTLASDPTVSVPIEAAPTAAPAPVEPSLGATPAPTKAKAKVGRSVPVKAAPAAAPAPVEPSLGSYFDEERSRKVNTSIDDLNVGDIVVLKIGNQLLGKVVSVTNDKKRNRAIDVNVQWLLGSGSVCSLTKLYKVSPVV